MHDTFGESGVVYQTEHGTVVRCRCCGRLELLFGPIALAEQRPFFRRLREVLASLSLDAPGSPPSARPFVVSVDGDKLAFRFTYAEARALRDLLDGADAMLDLDDLVRDALDPGDGDDADGGNGAPGETA
jgi:hypothetical protein